MSSINSRKDLVREAPPVLGNNLWPSEEQIEVDSRTLYYPLSYRIDFQPCSSMTPIKLDAATFMEMQIATSILQYVRHSLDSAF